MNWIGNTAMLRHLTRVFGMGGLIVAILFPEKWHIGIAMLLYAILCELISIADAHAKA